MDDRELAEIQHNKAVRGYIIRSLVKGYNNTALTRQLSNSMIAAGLIVSPDITKYPVSYTHLDVYKRQMPG